MKQQTEDDIKLALFFVGIFLAWLIPTIIIAYFHITLKLNSRI